ncbi:MAG: acetyl-CoA carboxylase carboxyltransferase subunit alpha [Lachnospiraceae bacterium]|nr:acetyl-CoA carboxylase carboxyltransferase subunit alpha [Lachnospiraceae bacterium]
MEILIEQLKQQLLALDKSEIQNESLRKELMQLIANTEQEAFEKLEPEDKVYLARHPLRPNAKCYIDMLFDGFMEMHGDRYYGDDQSMIGGVGLLKGIPVTIIGQVKGKTLEENMKRNFGMPHPEGYRKALRLAKQAEKFGRPIITLIDTPGAYPGIGAEERGQAEAIADCLKTFMELTVPIIAVVVGEGGSGGALAIGIADRIMMLEHSIYSVLSPEGFASILWKDASRAKEAAKLMKLTAQDLYQLGVVDILIEEPVGGIHTQVDFVMAQLKERLYEELAKLIKEKKDSLLQQRYEKFRRMAIPEVYEQ